MTESPFVKAKGPEPPDVADILGEKHRETMAQAIDELSRVSNSLGRAKAKLFIAYQLVGQLVGYLDSIEWGTHDEWTRSQSLRERAHEYLTGSNTIAT